MLNGKNTLEAVVGGGWAVGAFVFTRKNRISADRQALLAEVRITYTDNSEEIIGTDETWLVTMNGKYKYGDFYDGETYDAGLDLNKADWHAASLEKIKISPEITATYGALVKAREVMKPISCKQLNEEELIYDFGQNFAGVVRFKAKGRAGQIIIIKHAEVLKKDGSLNTELLRSAKATVLYICSGKDEEYSPRLTYMGFRYISVRGIKEENIDIDALALYSDIERTGDFSCSNQMLNKLNENILWSANSH